MITLRYGPMLAGLLVALWMTPVCGLRGQFAIGGGEVKRIYNQYCASCHGENHEGGSGGSLIDTEWKIVGKTRTFLDYVKYGDIENGMPAFEGGLSDAQIRALEIYLQEAEYNADRQDNPRGQPRGEVYEAGGYRFLLETVAEGIREPWSIAFMPDGRLLVTEKPGQLRFIQDGRPQKPISGLPEVWHRGQGGLMEVALHPDYATNGWVYLGYAANTPQRPNAGMTRVIRGRIVNHEWVDEEVLFDVPERFHNRAGVHFGVRFVFQDGYLFFPIGDRGAKEQAQDLTRPNGKIHRIHDDGRIPEDNPFRDQAGAYPTIWTYGNRNPQGLDAHPETGEIWETEHGPRGGDETNVIEKGVNYGWPVITYGMNYNGTPITERTEAPGMAQPKHVWTPSLGVCGIDFYEGDIFPQWRHNLLVGGLATRTLHRLVIEEGKVVQDEILLQGAGRVRDVASGPDGHIYLVLNGPDKIVRLLRE